MIEIRSYRRAFDLERRIYSVDGLRLNPGGVPVRGLVYYAAAALCALVVSRLPVLGWVLRPLPWYMRILALPAILAALLSVVRLDGRPFHLVARSLVLYWLGARGGIRLRGRAAQPRVWCPEPLLVLPDGSDARLRRLRYTGPGAVLLAREHELGGWRTDVAGALGRWSPRTVTVRPDGGERALADGKVVLLAARARLLVRPRRVRSA